MGSEGQLGELPRGRGSAGGNDSPGWRPRAESPHLPAIPPASRRHAALDSARLPIRRFLSPSLGLCSLPLPTTPCIDQRSRARRARRARLRAYRPCGSRRLESGRHGRPLPRRQQLLPPPTAGARLSSTPPSPSVADQCRIRPSPHLMLVRLYPSESGWNFFLNTDSQKNPF